MGITNKTPWYLKVRLLLSKNGGVQPFGMITHLEQESASHNLKSNEVAVGTCLSVICCLLHQHDGLFKSASTHNTAVL
eukprot:1160276-Pelagomonas_calceolata.AAC.14